MAQNDPDADVRNEAMRALSSSSDDSSGDDSPSNDGSDDGSNDGSNSGNYNGNDSGGGPINGTFYGAVIKCVKSAQATRYPKLPNTYSASCSPVLTGQNYQDLQIKLSNWQSSNCPSLLFIDEASSFTGTDGKTYVPNFVPANPKFSSSTSKSEVENAIQNGTCSAVSGINYGSWVSKARN